MLARPEIASVEPEGTAWSGTRFELARSTRVHWSSIFGSHRQPPSGHANISTASAPPMRRSVCGGGAKKSVRSADKCDPPALARPGKVEPVEVDAGAERPAAVVGAVPDDLVHARREPAGPRLEPASGGVVDAER